MTIKELNNCLISYEISNMIFYLFKNINNPNTLFVCGRGIVVDIINDEFGVMLGEFSINCFQTIIFHRRSTFIDKLCLSMVDLAEIFTNGKINTLFNLLLFVKINDLK